MILCWPARPRDGRQAVELVRRTRPDVILMDIRMPQLDGIAALADDRRAIRRWLAFG